jgi:hypothetical protein
MALLSYTVGLSLLALALHQVAPAVFTWLVGITKQIVGSLGSLF